MLDLRSDIGIPCPIFVWFFLTFGKAECPKLVYLSLIARSFMVFSPVIRLAEVEIEHASAHWPVTKFMIWHPTFSG
jgi:hypothetical protein